MGGLEFESEQQFYDSKETDIEPSVEKKPRFACVNSAGIDCMDAVPIGVEVMLLPGKNTTSFSIVGLGGKEIQQAKERVEAALLMSGFDMPSGKITVNLSPSSLEKKWTGFDLPIALGILQASGQVSADVSPMVIAGELSLDGKVKHTRGIFSAALLAKESEEFSHFIMPASDYALAGAVQLFHKDKELTIIPVTTLKELVAFLEGGLSEIHIPPQPEFTVARGKRFEDVINQDHIKKALEVTVAGGHNVLMVGPPGAGKSMLAEAMLSVMPPLTDSELLEVLKIASLKDIPQETIMEMIATRRRPFRTVDSGVSKEGLVGGTKGPGEGSLAHRGIMVLNEFPQVKQDAKEALRDPLSMGTVTVSRSDGAKTYPARFSLVATMNPCGCGYHGFEDEVHKCTCNEKKLTDYHNKISGPILDRIDMVLLVPSVPPGQRARKTGESSDVVRERVMRAREIQTKRFAGTDITCNAEIPSAFLDDYCPLGQEEEIYLQTAEMQMALSFRGRVRVIRLARTIADLEGVENIEIQHIARALDWRQKW